MFNRGILSGGLPILIACVLFGIFFPRPGVAQTPRDSLKEAAGASMERLLPVWRELSGRARTADSLRRERTRAEKQVPVDTFQVGPFHLVAGPRQRGMVEDLISEIWEELGPPFFGSELLLEPWTFLVRRSWSGEGMHLRGDSLVSITSRRQYPMSLLRSTAYSRIGRVLHYGLPDKIRDWTGPQSLSFSGESNEWVARELATAPSVAVRRCYRGDLDWCRRALGLADEEGSWDLWYTPPERRWVVSTVRQPTSDPRRAALWEGCVEFGELAACDLFLDDRDPEFPLSRTARMSLLAFSLQRGREGSFQELRRAGPASVEERLASAAGLPSDTLLASWRREVLGAQPSAWAGLARTPVVALLWFIFFGALAARSTRWRLG